jgi:hypothetical protein
MENKENYLEFISSESYKNQIDVWYRAYNISREKIELFHDFLISLHEIIEETYLGPDVLEDPNDQINHFGWCWDKTINNFNKERIFFKETGKHKDYFTNFYVEAFYIPSIEGVVKKIPEYFNKLFSFQHRKSRSELDILAEIYKLLDLNLKK